MFRSTNPGKILVLIALVFGFSFSVKAQVDCVYGFRIHVHDATGRTIENAKIVVSGLSEKDIIPADLLRVFFARDAYFVGIFGYGTTFPGDYLLKVSAEGYETYERQFKFPDCEVQSFELRLRPKGSTARADFERLFVVHGKVYDEEMKPFGGAKIEVKDAKGRAYQTHSNAYGYYEIDLPKGVVTVHVTDDRIADVAFDKFKVEKNYSVLNVPVCLKCKQKESAN